MLCMGGASVCTPAKWSMGHMLALLHVRVIMHCSRNKDVQSEQTQVEKTQVEANTHTHTHTHTHTRSRTLLFMAHTPTTTCSHLPAPPLLLPLLPRSTMEEGLLGMIAGVVEERDISQPSLPPASRQLGL